MSKQDNRITIAEQSLIRYLCESPDRSLLVEDSIFVTKTGKEFLHAILKLVKRQEPVNVESLTVVLNESEEIPRDRIKNLMSLEVPSDSFNIMVNRLQRESTLLRIKTDLIPNILDSTSSIDDIESGRTIELVDQLYNTIHSISGAPKVVYDLGSLVNEYEKRLYERESGKSFYTTGCRFLDERLTDGFAPQRITTIFGTSGVGKSTYALYLVNRQINKNIPCMYVSLEMDLVSTMDRLIAQRNKIDIRDLHPNIFNRGNPDDTSTFIPDHVFDIIEMEKEKLGKNPMFRFIEKPGLSLSEIEYYAKHFMQETGQDYMVLTVDLMSMIRDFNRTDNKAQSYEDAMNDLHAMVKRLGIHCVGVFQSRRPSQRVNVDNIDDLERFKPRIEEIKNSAAVEERSRIIMSTFRAKHFAERLFPDDPRTEYMQDIMEVDILKNNMGSLSNLKYLFKPSNSSLNFIVDGDVEVQETFSENA